MALGWMLYIHLYMTSNNPVKWLLAMISYFHLYYDYYMLQIFLTKIPLKKQKISH